jgi:ligand-binding sensor domain-containing protein/signal transduction histidine kinase
LNLPGDINLRKLLIFLLLIFSAVSVASAQQAVHPSYNTKDVHFKSPRARQYVFRHFSTVNGLASNLVNGIKQDAQGYIWMATINGLQRYDGNKFITFKHIHDDPTSLPNNNIAAIYIDKKNNLWVATVDNKIGLFNTSSFKYREVPLAWDEKNYGLYLEKRFAETTEGLIISMRQHGNFLYKPEKNLFVRYDELFPLPKGWHFNAWFQQSGTNRYWIACDSGLAMYDPLTTHLNYRDHNPDNDPVIKSFEDERSLWGIWINKYNKVLVRVWPYNSGLPRLDYYNIKTGEKRKHYLSIEMYGSGYYEIDGITETSNGRMWVYGRSFIIEYTGDDNSYYTIPNEYKDEQSIKYGLAYYMFEDNQQNLWICTDNGVFRFNPEVQLFNNYNLIRPNGTGVVEGPTTTLFLENNKRLWVGCWGVGLYCYDKDINPIAVPSPFKEIQNTYSIWCILQHSVTGLIWMGLQNGEIIVYDPIKNKLQKFSPAVFEGRTIRQITEDKHGNLWFGTHGGHIIKWDVTAAKYKVTTGYKLYGKTGSVYKLITDNRGYIWVAAFGEGIHKIDPYHNKTLHVFTKDSSGQSLSWNMPLDILQYDDTTILVANGALDVINLKTNKVSHITSEDGLPSNSVQCVQRDDKGIVWLGLSNGLCRMNLKQKIFTTYDRRDGIAFDNFNAAGAFRLPDGRLAFNNDHDFLVFDPDKISENKILPHVQITGFRLGNSMLSLDSLKKTNKITLPYDNTSIAIDFSAFNYLNHGRVLYYYMLEGLEKDWHQGYTINQAAYNYLPPGIYTFKVKAENVDGVASKNISALTIKVNAPFWKTWSFYAFLVLVIAVFLYWIDRERLRRLRALEQVRIQVANDLYEDINTTLSNINILSEMAKIKADKDIDRSKSYIDQIHEKSRKMISAMDDILWWLAPENDAMDKTILRMEEFIEGMKSRYNAEIEMVIDEKIKKLSLNMKYRHEFFLIFKETVKAIVQIAGGRKTLMNIDCQKNHLVLKLHDATTCSSDNQSEMDSCVAKIKNRAASIKAETEVHSDKSGTSIIVLFPLLK